MSKTIAAKNSSEIKSGTKVVSEIPTKKTVRAPIASTQTTEKAKVLTVVVLNEKGELVQGASVSITPSNISGVTNNYGEIQFTLGDNTKYDVTATADGKTVTIPYYVTQGGATRLIVNPVYVRKIEMQMHPFWSRLGTFSAVGVGLVVIIILVVSWNILRRKK